MLRGGGRAAIFTRWSGKPAQRRQEGSRGQNDVKEGSMSRERAFQAGAIARAKAWRWEVCVRNIKGGRGSWCRGHGGLGLYHQV